MGLPGQNTTAFGRLLRRLLVVAGASGMTLGCFLILPVIQAISAPPRADLVLQSVDTANLPPPPPPPPEEEPEEEPEPEEPPPEIAEDSQPLDLSQLELALNPGLGDGWSTGDFAVNLQGALGGQDAVEALFSAADLDQKPRIVYQPSPVQTAATRKKAPGTVQILFIVDKQGRVQQPIVKASSDPIFEKPALAAVKKWRFDPATRNGEPVSFRMKVPITFPGGR